MQHIVFTDLDGTLLDRDTYSWDAAREALALLRRQDIPLIFCTSKTRAEVEPLRHTLDNGHPFIVENGGGIYIPAGYFGGPVPGAVRRDGYELIELGTPYPDLVCELLRASAETDCPVRGFHQMDVAEIGWRCGLAVAEAVLARRREYDEPFVILGPRSDALLRAIERRGKRWTRGGHFFHVTGNHDKAEAAERLQDLYRAAHGPVRSVGLGDGWNDTFLRVVDLPVIIQSPFAAELKRCLPASLPTSLPGPAGWNEAILQMIPD